MKSITNWMNASVADIESNGLLDEATKIHVLSCSIADGKSYDIKGSIKQRLINFCNYHINNGIPVVGHNFICFDVPLLEKILDIDLSKLMVIDTLQISWYLNVDREVHGLDSFFDDYGIKKPFVDESDWDFQSDDPEELALHYERMRFRCSKDVAINKALWEDFKDRLIQMYATVKKEIDRGVVDTRRISEDEILYIDSLKGLSVEDHIDRLLTFLMSKTDKARLREKTRIKIDKGLLASTEKELLEKIKISKVELESVLPKVPVYAKKDKPKKPFLKSGELSASGMAWNQAIEGLDKLDELGNNLSKKIEGQPNSVKILKGYNEPKISSPAQIKNWLFSLGWEPCTFDYVKDKEAQQVWVDSGFKKELKPVPRKVPQLSFDGDEGKELCPSVVALESQHPEIAAYSGYTLIKHRYDFIQGFKRALSQDGYVKAEVGGMANTLREKHRAPICNIPSVSKPYGENLRGLLICEEGQCLLGSDLSALEDRVKGHFCLPIDPDYIASINQEGYDPHLSMCLTAGMISQKDYDDWTTKGIKSELAKAMRPKGKTSNYSLVYGSSPETLARTGIMTLKEAKKLHKAYWEIHWYVKEIAKEQVTFHCKKGLRWLINPVNGFCYSIRSEKDIFSTLIQGTGSYFFDVWVDLIIERMYKTWGKAILSGMVHDEFFYPIRDTEKTKDTFITLVKESILEVNKIFNIRVPLDCEIQFGKSYAEIH